MMRERRKQKMSNLMLVVMLIVLIAIFILLLMWNPQSATARPQDSQQAKIEQSTIIKEGMMAPDFKVEMFDGEPIRLSELRGKVVLVNFWATWCPPCREELTYVQADLIDRFKGQDFVFIPISRGEEYGTVAAFRKRMGYSFPMGLDPDQSIYRKFATNYIPRNFLIDRDGRVILASVGFTKQEFVEMVRLIEKAINNK